MWWKCQAVTYRTATYDLHSWSRVIGAVILSLGGSEFNDFIFSLWAVRLLFAISTPVMLAARTAETESCAASDWLMTGKRRQHLCNFTLLSSRPRQFVSLFLCFSICVDSFSSPRNLASNLSVSMYLFVFCAFARIIAWVHRLLVYGCAAEKLPSRQKWKLQKASSRKVNNCESHCAGEKLFLCCCCQHCGLQGKRSRSAERRHFNWTQTEIFNLHRNLRRHGTRVYTQLHARTFRQTRADVQAECCHFNGAD